MSDVIEPGEENEWDMALSHHASPGTRTAWLAISRTIGEPCSTCARCVKATCNAVWKKPLSRAGIVGCWVPKGTLRVEDEQAAN